MSKMWLCCPKCGSSLGLKRMGKVGVHNYRLGNRVHVPDSKRVKCELCGSIFRSRGVTMWESFGTDGENYF